MDGVSLCSYIFCFSNNSQSKYSMRGWKLRSRNRDFTKYYEITPWADDPGWHWQFVRRKHVLGERPRYSQSRVLQSTGGFRLTFERPVPMPRCHSSVLRGRDRIHSLKTFRLVRCKHDELRRKWVRLPERQKDFSGSCTTPCRCPRRLDRQTQ
jgi:hypothetical protein